MEESAGYLMFDKQDFIFLKKSFIKKSFKSVQLNNTCLMKYVPFRLQGLQQDSTLHFQ